VLDAEFPTYECAAAFLDGVLKAMTRHVGGPKVEFEVFEKPVYRGQQ